MPLSVQEQLDALRQDYDALLVRVVALEALAPEIERLMDRLPTWDGQPPQPPEPPGQ